MEAVAASIFVCCMFAALVVTLWVFWDEGSDENVRRIQDEERDRLRREAEAKRKK